MFISIARNDIDQKLKKMSKVYTNADLDQSRPTQLKDH